VRHERRPLSGQDVHTDEDAEQATHAFEPRFAAGLEGSDSTSRRTPSRAMPDGRGPRAAAPIGIFLLARLNDCVLYGVRLVKAYVDDFEIFFRECYGSVVRAVAMAVGDRGRAEDLAQEAFARAFRRWRVVSAMERPVTWVYVVAMNAERSRWRREERASRCDDQMQVVLDDPATGVTTGVVVRDALGRLPPRQRCAVALRYLADLRIAEVAEVMGCAEGTVKATLHQALRNLRVDLEGEEP
jgi:RNA polymerase sigma-70 factor (ECF subfamily)